MNSQKHVTVLQAYSRSSATVWDAVNVVGAKKVVSEHRAETDATDDLWNSELTQVVADLQCCSDPAVRRISAKRSSRGICQRCLT